MRSLPVLITFAAAALTAFGAPAAPESTKTAKMPFADCLSIIAEVTQEAGAMPAILVSTANLRTVRINADDGFVTLSCARAEGTMTLSKAVTAAAAPAVTAMR